ncbi:hypothetical protein ACFU9Q_44155, partial [Streptomyces sp. NPDC057579]
RRPHPFSLASRYTLPIDTPHTRETSCGESHCLRPPPPAPDGAIRPRSRPHSHSAHRCPASASQRISAQLAPAPPVRATNVPPHPDSTHAPTDTRRTPPGDVTRRAARTKRCNSTENSPPAGCAANHSTCPTNHRANDGTVRAGAATPRSCATSPPHDANVTTMPERTSVAAVLNGIPGNGPPLIRSRSRPPPDPLNNRPHSSYRYGKPRNISPTNSRHAPHSKKPSPPSPRPRAVPSTRHATP